MRRPVRRCSRRHRRAGREHGRRGTYRAWPSFVFGAARDYLSSCRTCDGNWFACAIIAVPACWRICARARFAVSTAKSASWIRLRDAVRFSLDVVRFSIVEENRFWIAPSAARLELIAVSAASTADSAAFAPWTVEMSTDDIAVPVAAIASVAA